MHDTLSVGGLRLQHRSHDDGTTFTCEKTDKTRKENKLWQSDSERLPSNKSEAVEHGGTKVYLLMTDKTLRRTDDDIQTRNMICGSRPYSMLLWMVERPLSEKEKVTAPLHVSRT